MESLQIHPLTCWSVMVMCWSNWLHWLKSIGHQTQIGNLASRLGSHLCMHLNFTRTQPSVRMAPYPPGKECRFLPSCPGVRTLVDHLFLLVWVAFPACAGLFPTWMIFFTVCIWALSWVPVLFGCGKNNNNNKPNQRYPSKSISICKTNMKTR